ncbi:MAG: hypothetical protein KAS64_06810 [Spirochaetes bacterium]|nr:hypothetical protein [Spirochaetota bacterium]
MSKFKLLKEFMQYLRSHKKLWLLPILIIFLLFGLVILLSQSQALAPLIYSVF